MADLKKVIKGMECCVISDNEGVCPDDCPYYDECWADKIKIEKQLKKDALALLKAQQPRVLTLEEVINNCPDCVYIEGRSGWLECVVPDVGESDKTWGIFVSGIYEDFQHEWRLYGKMWRCWSARPTDKQRKAVKWE